MGRSATAILPLFFYQDILYLSGDGLAKNDIPLNITVSGKVIDLMNGPSYIRCVL
jgi:hypothetical protein